MSSKKPTQPIGSSVDVGWSDGRPRDVTDETKEFLEASGGGRVGASQISGRQPRPRSKNLPKPSLTVNYQDVARNATEGADLGQASLEELLLQNAEAVKQVKQSFPIPEPILLRKVAECISGAAVAVESIKALARD